MADRSAPFPALHSNLALLYREKISNLAAALNSPEAQAGAAQSLGGLIDKVVLTPGVDGYSIGLEADLAGILTLASDTKAKNRRGCSTISGFASIVGCG